jgi:ACT domain-containing protein
MQDNEHKLQQAEGGTEQTSDNIKAPLEESPISEPNVSEEAVSENKEENKTESSDSKEDSAKDSDSPNDPIDEIDESNAEDAEDTDNEKRHYIPFLDYHSMPMENLVGELQKLVRNEKVQAIGKHVSAIKYEFDQKFQEFLEHKKEEFVSKGGNEIDFKYNSVAKRQFNEVYADYREKRDQYYKQLEQNLKNNLQKRLEIIEELKGLIDVEEDINTTYNNFKNLQESWKNAGPIPRNHYNDVWRTYHHHMEIFYDFLHLNRELRDLDFKHNLEEKQKLVERAEALADEPDLNKAFRELQTLHKIWKEDIGPVAKENREEIWERFSNATKAMHQRRQEHFQEQEKVYEKNLEKKQDIIASIVQISGNVANSHRALQQQISEVEKLRDSFFKAGKVPQRVNEETWSHFKDAVRKFNRNKNAFYKNQKKEQQQNLDKKKALLDLAISLKDRDDWDEVTPEMKRIQSEWKKIGHVPRRYSDKIWKDFKDACNHYFDRLHSDKNEAQKDEYENFEKKNACLERLKEFQLSGDKKKDLAEIKEFLAEWKQYGRIPYNKKHINGKFSKIVDALLKKLGVSRQESELIKYGNKVQELAKTEDDRAIGNERVFIRRKIDESKSEIRQLENNLQFFSNDSEDNPLVQEVIKNIDNQKEALQTWKEKLKKLNILENRLNREAEEEENSNDNEEE